MFLKDEAQVLRKRSTFDEFARLHVSIRLRRGSGQVPIYLNDFHGIRNASTMVALDRIADHPTTTPF